MFLIDKGYATVWTVEDKGNFVKGRISTSEKDRREEGKYINSNWFATFVGQAKEKAEHLQERDRIVIKSAKITNTTSGEGENKKSFVNVVIFDFDMNDQQGYSKPQNNSAPNYNVDEDDSELPF
ncbi:MAG TPA: hypothetical protein GX708_24640 [Gallicola sp.]|jgi:hypothetical protein|nr:hypothetical protein [Gallicola sp.]